MGLAFRISNINKGHRIHTVETLGVRALPFQTELCVDVFPPGLECPIGCFGTTLVVSSIHYLDIRPPLSFPVTSQLWRRASCLGTEEGALAVVGPLAAPSTCGTYNFIGKMRASVFSPREVFFKNLPPPPQWFIFWLLYFCSGSTVFTSCLDKEPFLLRMITTD